MRRHILLLGAGCHGLIHEILGVFDVFLNCYWVVELWKIFKAPKIILTCRMPSDTPNNITGHVDLLLSGEMSMHDI